MTTATTTTTKQKHCNLFEFNRFRWLFTFGLLLRVLLLLLPVVVVIVSELKSFQRKMNRTFTYASIDSSRRVGWIWILSDWRGIFDESLADGRGKLPELKWAISFYADHPPGDNSPHRPQFDSKRPLIPPHAIITVPLKWRNVRHHKTYDQLIRGRWKCPKLNSHDYVHQGGGARKIFKCDCYDFERSHVNCVETTVALTLDAMMPTQYAILEFDRIVFVLEHSVIVVFHIPLFIAIATRRMGIWLNRHLSSQC